MQKLIQTLEQGKFTEAVKQADALIDVNASSELYRLRGQAKLELGNIDNAIDDLIESLVLDPENINSLILVGNIYYKEKNDFSTADTYYSQVLELDTKNYLALTNLAGIFANEGQIEKAKELFEKSVQIKPNYINAQYGLALLAYKSEEYLSTYNHLVTCIKQEDFRRCEENLQESVAALFNKNLTIYDETINHEEVYESFKKSLEKKAGVEIKIEQDNSIPVTAKLEVAENYNRNYHLVKLNSKGKARAYFILHELLHLELILEARQVGENKLFITNEHTKNQFKIQLDKSTRWNRLKEQLGKNTSQLLDRVYTGLMTQVYNAPIDLFIENTIYTRFPHARPLQALGMFNTSSEAILSFNNEKVVNTFPKLIRNTNIIYSSVQLLQLKELHGIDLLEMIRDKRLLLQGTKFYQEFTDVKDDKEVAEEYEIVRLWAEDVNIDNYFELKPEVDSLENQLSRIEEDPFNLQGDSSYEDNQMELFLKNHKSENLNMPVFMYMVDAMKHFNSISQEKVKEIGLEIALLGRTGIDPKSKEKYNLAHVKGKQFTGWMLLAWMYVSWMQFEPRVVPSFGLEFEDEYQLATKFKDE